MKLRDLTPIVAIVGAELAIAAIVLTSGFVAVSDDDFSRVVIAERFVAEPSLDPSGSSWLPLPFLILGIKMLFLGRTLAVARLVAVGESAFALLLFYRAARNLALSSRAALAGTVLAAVIPTAARLGVSFQPEALTAGLVVYAASTLSKSGRERLFGGLALGAATLCRYEPWPAALVFAVFCAVDVVAVAGGSTEKGTATTTAPDGGRPLLVAAALVAVVPPVLWMLHGASRHANAIFFLARASAYRHALGGVETPLASLAAYPEAFARSEPGLLLAAAALLVAGRRSSTPWFRRCSRQVAMFIALFAFLVVGRLLGGAPTHHEERPLLSIFWALVLAVAGYAWGEEQSAGRSAPRRDILAGGVIACIALGSLFRFVVPAEEYSARGAETAIGAEAKRRLGRSDRLLVDTADYGYFAVIAAFGAPERAEAFDRRDPREMPRSDAFASSDELRARLGADRATWFVARREYERIGSELATPVARNEKFVLCRTNAAPVRANTE